MTPEEILRIEKARLDLRERLRLLVVAWGQEVKAEGMEENVSSGIVAEECMHMSSYFAIRGLGWGLEQFLERTGEVYDIHRALLRKEQQRKMELN